MVKNLYRDNGIMLKINNGGVMVVVSGGHYPLINGCSWFNGKLMVSGCS